MLEGVPFDLVCRLRDDFFLRFVREVSILGSTVGPAAVVLALPLVLVLELRNCCW